MKKHTYQTRYTRTAFISSIFDGWTHESEREMRALHIAYVCSSYSSFRLAHRTQRALRSRANRAIEDDTALSFRCSSVLIRSSRHKHVCVVHSKLSMCTHMDRAERIAHTTPLHRSRDFETHERARVSTTEMKTLEMV